MSAKRPEGKYTTTRVIVVKDRKKRRKGQLALFAAERLLVTRTYNQDGELIGYNAVPIVNFRRLD